MPVIAVLGAGSDRRKFGNKCVRAYQSVGWTVVPVHPRDVDVEGLPTYRSVSDIPAGRLDRVSVYLPPAVGVNVMAEIAARGDVGEVWLNPGADGADVVAAGKSAGLNVVCGCSIVDVGVSPHDLDE